MCGRPLFPVGIMPDLTVMRACAVCDRIGEWPRSSAVIILPEPARPYDWERDDI